MATISLVNPRSAQAVEMSAALWVEIQRRYDFTAPNPMDPAGFDAFWIATEDGRAIGSIALTTLGDGVAELDVMYVAPAYRQAGVARALLAALEEHARAAGITAVRLRAGEPQPEALRFYAAAGFAPIPPFGKWVGDETARCFEKDLTAH